MPTSSACSSSESTIFDRPPLAKKRSTTLRPPADAATAAGPRETDMAVARFNLPRGALEAARRRAPSPRTRENRRARRRTSKTTLASSSHPLSRSTPLRRDARAAIAPNRTRLGTFIHSASRTDPVGTTLLGVLVAADAPAGRRWSRIPHSTLAHVGIATARLNVRFRFKRCPIHDGRVSARDGRLAPVRPRSTPLARDRRARTSSRRSASRRRPRLSPPSPLHRITRACRWRCRSVRGVP